jgi:purine-binding chemotaxis protein CheW
MAEARNIRLITFLVGPERFVFDIMAIREIIMYAGATTIPRLPSFIEGVIVLRNEVIPVIDLRRRLFPETTPSERHPLILVCRSEVGTIGLKVEGVREIINVSTDQILPPPELIRGLQGDLFIGVVNHLDRVYLLIDVHTVLTPDEKQMIREAHITLEELEAAGGRPAAQESAR